MFPGILPLAGMLPQLFGQSMGQAAPAFNLGQEAQQGLLGGAPQADPMQGAPQANPMQDAMGALQSAQAAQDPVTSKPSVFNTQQQNAAMPQEPGGFGGFLGGIDKGLQSPSQMLGLGLLSQLGGNSNALPLAGLLGMGLLNRKK